MVDELELLTATPVHTVQLDGLALLKMIKHCRDGLPHAVTGQLLGMDVDGRLEVTHSFPFLSALDGSAGDRPGGMSTADYQMNMMRCLRDVNVDHSAVGWYQSSFSGSFINSAVIEAQFKYQQSISNSVILIYDPFTTQQGQLCINAYRLSDAFMQLYKERKFTRENIEKVDLLQNGSLVEVPLTIKTSNLTAVLIGELTAKEPVENHDILRLVSESHLERHLESMSTCLDDLAQDQYKWNRFLQFVARQKQSVHHQQMQRERENKDRVAKGLAPLPEEDFSLNMKPVHEPSRLESILLHAQMDHYCSQISEFTASTTRKLFYSEELQKQSHT